MPDQQLASRRGRLLTAAPLLGAGALAVAVVVILQIHGRGWLAYDEAARVEPGYRLSLLLQGGHWASVWGWLNDQTFYPFAMPAIHGLLLWAGVGTMAAAWLPSLAAYATAGLLTARLTRALGGGSWGALGAAILFWTVPLEMRLASGAFTEPLGICVDLALVLALIRLQRRPGVRDVAVCGALIAVASWIKWDYGIVAVLVVAVSALVIRGGRRPTLVALGAGIVIAGALLAVNAPAKLAGFTWYTGQAAPSGAHQVNLLYYLQQLLPGAAEVNVSLVATALLVLGAATGVREWRRRPEVRPVVVLVAVLYVLYSVATIKHPRYVATMIPPLAVLAGVGLGRLLAARWASLGSRRALAAAAVSAAVVLEAGPMGVRLPWLDANPAADVDRGRAVDAVANAPGRVLLLGSDNWVSPDGVRLLVELRVHHSWWQITTPPGRPAAPYTVVHARG
ncbi:MAG: hypothetical protein ACRENL_07425 [Candidatus Dormibacteria bacterium]